MLIRIQKKIFFYLFFPLIVTLFVGNGIRCVDMLKLGNIRWVMMVMLFLYCLLNRKLLKGLGSLSVLTLFLYFTWCISTTLWSATPLLSFTDSIAMAIVCTTLISAGSLWIVRFGYTKCFYAFVGVAAIALCSVLLGKGMRPSVILGSVVGNETMGNPNQIGMVLAISSIFPLWKFYSSGNDKKHRVWWGGLLIMDLYFLIITFSRSAVMITAFIFLFYFLSISLSKKFLVASSTILLTVIMAVSLPTSTINSFVMDHIYKNTQKRSLYQSREMAWKRSYQNAMQGGWFGTGYSCGASVSQNHFKILNLVSPETTQEKGNAQLASIAETGIVGFCLYLFMLVVFFMNAIPSFQKMTGDAKVVMGLLLGGITGLLAESLVEAWWNAPGAQETICFWTLMGLTYGMIYLQKKHPALLVKLSYASHNTPRGTTQTIFQHAPSR